MQVSFRILLYDTVLAALEANRQKARDNYAKLTDEQKAQRKPTPVVAALPSNEASGNIDKISCYDFESKFLVL